MRLGVRGRLFFASLAVLLAVGLPIGLVLEHQLSSWLDERVTRELTHHARLASEAVRIGGFDLDELADRLGGSTESRITIIAPDGRVVGDSEVERDALAGLDNHGGRPEVKAALDSGFGTARRRSATLDQRMLYVAVPTVLEGQQAVIRSSVPLAEVDDVISGLRWMMIAAGLVGLAIALMMTFWASALVSRPVRQLVDRSASLVHTEPPPPTPSQVQDPDFVPGSVATMARELERTLDTLAKERDRFETVLEGMNEALVALDAERRIVMTNPAADTLLNLHAVQGRRLTEVVDAPELKQLAGAGQDARPAVEFTLGERQILARATTLSSARGAVIVMHDVTDMRRLETVRKDFVANVSHELRTPVSIIRANAETLLDGGLEDPGRAPQFVSAIHRHAERLADLIADLLDLSRIEAGRYKLNFKNLDCLQAALRGIDAVGEKANKRGVEIVTDCVDGLQVRADPKALDQVLMNLLDNATKYAADSGVVRIEVEEQGDNIWFGVKDNGRGIAPEQRARIFERFYRVDPGRSRDMGGTGLGLAIVKHLVESMGGRVGVSAGEPSGSVFWFVLPRVRQPVLADERAA